MGDKMNGKHQEVSEYYGKVLKTSTDLKTNACTTAEAPPAHILNALRNVHPEVSAKYYGCGMVIPDCLEGLRVLDLGCGAGRDVYVLSALVGPTGSVVGVDMTSEQLDVARQYVDWHMTEYGYPKPNVEFTHGYIEKLEFPDSSFDLIVSNCVVNLSPDKEAVLREAYRVLKPGGELYFSDVYSDRRVPKSLVDHPVLYGECLSGALYVNDFVHLARRAGFKDPRIVKTRGMAVTNEQIAKLLGPIQFASITYRLWKLPRLEPDCEDYGQAVIYKGTVPTSPEALVLDSGHTFDRNRVAVVCGNTFIMLQDTRFAPHFTFIGDFSTHFGLFVCTSAAPIPAPDKSSVSCC